MIQVVSDNKSPMWTEVIIRKNGTSKQSHNIIKDLIPVPNTSQSHGGLQQLEQTHFRNYRVPLHKRHCIVCSASQMSLYCLLVSWSIMKVETEFGFISKQYWPEIRQSNSPLLTSKLQVFSLMTQGQQWAYQGPLLIQIGSMKSISDCLITNLYYSIHRFS